jgi:molecular chaperone HscB
VAAGTPSPSAEPHAGAPADPFALLGLEPAFELDLRHLEARHRELSRTLHPDRYAGRPSSERRQALGRAIEVNEAFRRLRDPIRRGEALLAHFGRPVSETGAERAEPALLMEVMERREALGDARRSRDLAAVRALAASVRERETHVLGELSAAFDRAPPELVRAERLLGELRYHRRFLDEAAAAEDDLDEADA